MGKKLLFISVSFFVIIGLASPAVCQNTDSKILNHYGRGYLEEKADGLKVLHLIGDAYERGYQRGMLQDDLTFVTSSNIMEAVGWFGDEKMIRDAKAKMEPYIPYEVREEIMGMADALAKRGSPITYDDIVLHVVASDFGMMDPSKHDLGKPSRRLPYPGLTRCSSFSGWGNATKDGELIVGANSAYYDTEEELINRPIAVVEPTNGGYAYIGSIWDVFFVTGGINEAGIAINGQLCLADEESLLGLSAELMLKKILQYANSIEDAVEIVTTYPRTCGIIIHVADAKTKRAVVIEYTSDHLAVRTAEPGKDVLWTTNHFNAYPGWKGYSGESMAEFYDERAKLEDVSTLGKWQDSLAAIGKGRAGRFGRYEQLLDDHYGKLTVDTAQEILKDTFSLEEKRTLAPDEPSSATISQLFEDWVVYENAEYYRIDRSGELRAKYGDVFSYVATPATGDIWIAVGVPRAQYTSGYKHLNLFDELSSRHR